MLPFWAKGIRCLVSLPHNESGVLGAKRIFMESTSCVKVFRSMFKALSFRGLTLIAKGKVC